MKEQKQWLNQCVYILVKVVTKYYGVFSILSSSFLQEIPDEGVDGEDKEINIAMMKSDLFKMKSLSNFPLTWQCLMNKSNILQIQQSSKITFGFKK